MRFLSLVDSLSRNRENNLANGPGKINSTRSRHQQSIYRATIQTKPECLLELLVAQSTTVTRARVVQLQFCWFGRDCPQNCRLLVFPVFGLGSESLNSPLASTRIYRLLRIINYAIGK